MSVTSGRVKPNAHRISSAANGAIVYADLNSMPLASNIGRNPHLLRLVEEALQSHELTEADELLECDMERPVGYDDIVATGSTDTVFYARAAKAAAYTRFVRNKKPTATNYITIDLRRDAEGDYELHDVWLGRAYPCLPSDVDATEESKTYWAGHALIFSGQSLISSTLTKTCPY